MAQNPVEWLEAQDDRIASRLRAQADNYKLIATFATGIAATLVATALQVEPVRRLDDWATYVLGASTLLATLLYLLDRQQEADEGELLRSARTHSWTDQELLDAMRDAQHAAQLANRDVVKWMRRMLYVAIFTSTTSGIIACVALLS